MIEEIQKDYQEAIQQEETLTQDADFIQESSDTNQQSDSDSVLLERVESLTSACNDMLEDFENISSYTVDLLERVNNLEKNGIPAQDAESSIKTSDDNFVYIDKLIKDDTLEREKAMKEEILQAIKANQPKKKSNSTQNIINFIVIFGMIALFYISLNKNHKDSSQNQAKQVKSSNTKYIQKKTDNAPKTHK